MCMVVTCTQYNYNLILEFCDHIVIIVIDYINQSSDHLISQNI